MLCACVFGMSCYGLVRTGAYASAVLVPIACPACYVPPPHTPPPLSLSLVCLLQCALKFKANKLGLVPEGNALVFNNVAPGSSGPASVVLNCVASQASPDPLTDKVMRPPPLGHVGELCGVCGVVGGG